MHVEQYIHIILHRPTNCNILNHFTQPRGRRYRPLVSKMILKLFFQVIPGLSQCLQWLHRV